MGTTQIYINRLTDKPRLHAHSESQSTKWSEQFVRASTEINLKIIMLRKRNQMKKDTYYLSLFIKNSRKYKLL